MAMHLRVHSAVFNAIFLISVAACSGGVQGQPQTDDSQPNIVLFFADDQGSSADIAFDGAVQLDFAFGDNGPGHDQVS